MPSDSRPQTAFELQLCARHLVQQPLTCMEHDPEIFRMVRRHEGELDRWFTQRLGYRLHVRRRYRTTVQGWVRSPAPAAADGDAPAVSSARVRTASRSCSARPSPDPTWSACAISLNACARQRSEAGVVSGGFSDHASRARVGAAVDDRTRSRATELHERIEAYARVMRAPMRC